MYSLLLLKFITVKVLL